MRDIEEIALKVQREMPEITSEQLAVKHPGADDDGLWFFRNPLTGSEVQLESASGNCPFLFESSHSDIRTVASDVQQAVELIVTGLGLRGPAA